jgi:hypothetical protein
MRMVATAVSLAGVLAVFACTEPPPSGPTVAVMPGQNKTFEQFQTDDYNCRNFAQSRIGIAPGQAAANSAVASAAVGTLGGAAIGALAGAAGGNAGLGAAAGAGAGLLLGSAAGAGASQQSYAWAQHDYDVAYMQCMVSNGNQAPQGGYSGYPGYYPPPGYAYRPYGYPYPYPYAYPGYAYPGYYPSY